MRERDAWRAKYRRDRNPWRGAADLRAFEPWLPAPGARVLELGGGGGKTHRALAARGLRSVPLDWAPEALPPGGVLGDARSLPLRAGTFDAVVAIHVLDHQDGPGRRRLADEAERVLAPGGVLLVQAFAEGDLRAASGRAVAERTREREGIPTHYARADEVAALFPRLRALHVELVERPTRFAGPRRLVVGAWRRPHAP